MNWIKLKDEKELETIKNASHDKPIVIFKHSTRCSISSAALNRLERTWSDGGIKATDTYYLDLISFRNISNKIESVFEVEHESPQLLLIENGTCTYHTSHMNISFDGLKKFISAN